MTDLRKSMYNKFWGNGMKYLKMNNSNWRKLCKNQIKAEQQQMKLEDRKQIKFNFEKEKK